MADQKKMRSVTFHSDPALAPMEQDKNSESNYSSSELCEKRPAQIGKDETEGQCRCIVSPKELPSSQYRENVSASPRPRDSSSKSVNPYHADLFFRLFLLLPTGTKVAFPNLFNTPPSVTIVHTVISSSTACQM